MTYVLPHLASRFRRAGWFEGRQVRVDPSVPREHPAYGALAELGGICLTRGPDDDFIEEVSFQYLHWADGMEKVWEKALSTRLVPIAEMHNANSTMLMSSDGVIFEIPVPIEGFWFRGRSLAEAVANIFADIRPRPMVIDHGEAYLLYDKRFRRADPDLFAAASPEGA